MSRRKQPTLMEQVHELLNRRDEVSRELYALEDSLYKAEQRYLRSNLQNESGANGTAEKISAENDGGGRIPSPNDFIFSNSSVTLKTALDLHSRTLELRKRREERARRMSVEAISASEDGSDSSDTDPELGGLAAFGAAAKRDAELREQFKREYESSHSEKSENSP